MDEPMTLVERLRNPSWTTPDSRTTLDISRTRLDMEEAAAEIVRLRADLDLARTGRMMTLAELRAWCEADHEDAIVLHRNCIIAILAEVEQLTALIRHNAPWLLDNAALVTNGDSSAR